MLLLLSLSTALAQTTHCTATDGSGLVYQTGRHGGGAQPGVGVEVASPRSQPKPTWRCPSGPRPNGPAGQPPPT